jgi:hypothetical protein
MRTWPALSRAALTEGGIVARHALPGPRPIEILQAEPFRLWVIEAPPEVAEALPLASAGVNVIWTDNIGPYRKRKVRLLNGTHTAGALASVSA